MDETRERRQSRIVWESLERAADHLPPGHPAELSIRRALHAAEAHWRALPPPHAGTDYLLIDAESAGHAD